MNSGGDIIPSIVASNEKANASILGVDVPDVSDDDKYYIIKHPKSLQIAMSKTDFLCNVAIINHIVGLSGIFLFKQKHCTDSVAYAFAKHPDWPVTLVAFRRKEAYYNASDSSFCVYLECGQRKQSCDTEIECVCYPKAALKHKYIIWTAKFLNNACKHKKSAKLHIPRYIHSTALESMLPRNAPLISINNNDNNSKKTLAQVAMYSRDQIKQMQHRQKMQSKRDNDPLVAIAKLRDESRDNYETSRKLDVWMRGNIHGLAENIGISLFVGNHRCKLSIYALLCTVLYVHTLCISLRCMYILSRTFFEKYFLQQQKLLQTPISAVLRGILMPSMALSRIIEVAAAQL